MEDFKHRKNDDGSVTFHHQETNQPLFHITPTKWGREVRAAWHPALTDLHPGLKNTHEFSMPKTYFKNRASASIDLHSHYRSAEASGFKDAVNVEDKAHPEGHKTRTFSDPDTGEVIGTRSTDSSGSGQYSHNPEYLKKHNIDLPTLTTKGAGHTPYKLAKLAKESKGKKARLTGVTGNSTSPHKLYKVNTTPEDGSSAHEEYIKKQHPKVEITRFTPTSFVATSHPDRLYGTGKHISSHIEGEHLHAVVTSFSHPDYDGNKNNHVIESHDSPWVKPKFQKKGTLPDHPVGSTVQIKSGVYKGTSAEVMKSVRRGANYRVKRLDGTSALYHHKDVRLKEEAPTNSAGAGAVAGVGVGPNGEPGKKKFKDFVRRR